MRKVLDFFSTIDDLYNGNTSTIYPLEDTLKVTGKFTRLQIIVLHTSIRKLKKKKSFKKVQVLCLDINKTSNTFKFLR